MVAKLLTQICSLLERGYVLASGIKGRLVVQATFVNFHSKLGLEMLAEHSDCFALMGGIRLDGPFTCKSRPSTRTIWR
jgi:hypothetical protein